jgi:hypothetical protein
VVLDDAAALDDAVELDDDVEVAGVLLSPPQATSVALTKMAVAVNPTADVRAIVMGPPRCVG